MLDVSVTIPLTNRRVVQSAETIREQCRLCSDCSRPLGQKDALLETPR